MNSFQMNHRDPAVYSKQWGWLFTWGLILIILGLIAISVSELTTFISVIFIGAIILVSGVVIIIDAFKFWWQKWSGFFLHLIMGILYVIAGTMLIESPVLGAMSLTLVLGVFYLVLGIFRLIYSFSLRTPNWGWSLLSGIIALILGLLILANWPASSLIIIGLFVGIDLVFLGWTYIMVALTGREFLSKV